MDALAHVTANPVTAKENKMKITKRQLRRIIREEKAKVLAEQKVRRIVRRRLLEANVLRPNTPDELLAMIAGKEADLSLGGSGMVIYLDGNYTDGYINAENALDQMFGEMGPEAAIEALRGSAGMLEIDEETMMELGLD